MLTLVSFALAAPITLLHQARLLDPAGAPIEGPQQVSVSLHDQASGGTEIWSDTFSVTAEQGFFSVQLGSGAALDSSDLYQEAVWIELSVAGIVERQQLMTVPYAAVARSVDGDRGLFSGSVIVGTETDAFCEANTAGALVWRDNALEVCNGTDFVTISGASIVNDGGSRRWSDGTFAASCARYKNPVSGRVYTGDIGTGVYTIDPDGDGNGFDAYCEMEFDGGGWTLVAYNFNRQRTFLTSTYSAVGTSNPVTPTSGFERAINPEALGVAYSQIAFYIDDPQWETGSRSYTGWWLGDNAASTYRMTSNTCQVLSATDASQWSGELVYFAGDGGNDNGCTGGGSFFTSSGHTCDDGGGGITTNNAWPRNASDSVWGYNCISSYSPTGAYKFSPIGNQGLHAYYVR